MKGVKIEFVLAIDRGSTKYGLLPEVTGVGVGFDFQ